MTLTSGQLLAQRYRLGRRIAIGGMGEVWEAADTRLDRRVAVKVLKPELSGDAEFRYRFHTEAMMTASLNHPGIAAVHDYGEMGDDPGSANSGANSGTYPGAYLVMELIAGDPLATILMRLPRLPIDRTLDVLEQAAGALQAAHERSLVHRDIKPGNILITAAGTVKLTDFGIARAIDAAPVTRHGMVMGTAHYIAPEQAAGREAGPPGDVYSLAVVGYECLAGQRPFLADNAVTVAMMHIHDRPPPLPPDVPAGVRALIEAALAKDPRQRYGSGGEFAAAVAAVRAGHRLPLPVGMAAKSPARTSVVDIADKAPPPTALLPSAAATGPYPTAGYLPRQRSDQRATARIAMGLLGVLALVLSGYLVNDALRSDVTSPDAAAGVGTVGIGIGTAPQAPVVPKPVIPQPFEPTEEQFPPRRTDPSEQLRGVLIVPSDYLRERASDAAVTAKIRGLVPRVVDEDGDQVERNRRSQCRVTNVRPLAGFVPRGSSLELTCRRVR